MKSIYSTLLFIFFFSTAYYPQNQYTIMAYNLLNYPGNDSAIRNPYFRTVIESVVPDVLVVQEMLSQAGVNGFLNNVLNVASSGYSAGTFLDGPDTDNAIFYKSASFTFLANNVITTDLRNINEFVLKENLTGDILRIYSLHLKAGSTSSDQQQRLTEVTVLRNVTDNLPANSNFIVCGDFNIYGSTETCYQKLLNQTTQGYFVDIYNLPGTWNNSAYAQYHTQSPRVRQFGGGANGGMDDRFDMILMSHAVMDSEKIYYLPDSFVNYGNDGLHFNDSINRPPNNAVSQQIANAIHYSSDHIPVFAKFSFTPAFVELSSFTALIEGLYNGISMVPDTVIIELRNTSFPYSLVDQTKILLNSNGQGSSRFYNAVNGTSYYLVLKHRNAIETWSATGQTFTNNALTYDFTTDSSKAFGNNLTLKNGKWCIYSGDVNQDGFVEAGDLNLVYTDNVNGVTGYVATDLNGDMFTEIEDLNKVFINNVLGVERKRPADFP